MLARKNFPFKESELTHLLTLEEIVAKNPHQPKVVEMIFGYYVV